METSLTAQADEHEAESAAAFASTAASAAAAAKPGRHGGFRRGARPTLGRPPAVRLRSLGSMVIGIAGKRRERGDGGESEGGGEIGGGIIKRVTSASGPVWASGRR